VKLPENFPEISKPYFIFGTPAWIQYFLIGIIILFQLVLLFLAYRSIFVLAEPIWVDILLTALAVGFFTILTRKQIWSRWVSLVVNADGCYFHVQYSTLIKFKITNIDKYNFLAWKNIGEITIENVDDSTGRSKSLVILIKVTQEDWENQFSVEQYLPKWANFFKSKANSEGYQQYILSNEGQNLEKVKIEILKFKNSKKIVEF
jgi:hypothetical protein